MASVLVIGYGNPLRKDDGLGWRVAEALTTSNSDPEVEILACQQLNLELAEPISRAGLVIFVDAEEAAAPDPGRSTATHAPGTIVERELTSECQSPRCFSHDLTPSTLLACAGELFGSTPKAKMFSVVGSDFGMGEELSPLVATRMPELLGRVKECLRAPALT
jgi:hydrogenase maturation protease